MGKDAREIRLEIAETRDRMSETVEAIGFKADVPSRVRDAVNERVETVKGTVENTVETVRGTVTNGTNAASDAIERADTMAAENPLQLAIACLVGGFFAGLIMPKNDGR